MFGNMNNAQEAKMQAQNMPAGRYPMSGRNCQITHFACFAEATNRALFTVRFDFAGRKSESTA